MKNFKEYVKTVNEAVPLNKLNSRIEVVSGRPFSAEFGLRIESDKIIGVVAFGSVGVARTLIVDNNYAFDQKLARSRYVARIQNSLTAYAGGYVENATLAKFDLEKGTMWLAEQDNEDGSISWGRGFKFKRLILNEEVSKDKGWVDKESFGDVY